MTSSDTGASGSGSLDFGRLKSLVATAQSEQLVEALSSLAEGERRALSKKTWKLYRDIENDKMQPPPEATAWQELAWFGAPVTVREASQLAVLGVCPESRWRQVRRWDFDTKREALLIRVLKDRRAPWLGAWLGSLFESDFERPVKIRTVLQLARAGACDRPDSADWVLALAQARTSRWRAPDGPRPLHQRLLEEPDIIEHELWRLFEIETPLDLWYPRAKLSNSDDERWGGAMLRLAEQGHVERARLLDACLDGLASAFKTAAFSPLRRFHDDLNPSIDEIASRQGAYRLLLGGRVGSVVTLALKTLAGLVKTGLLDESALLAALPPVFELPAKAQPLRALRLLKQLMRSGTDLEVTELLGLGLDHAQEDVQQLAADLLLDRAESAREAVVEVVEWRLPSLPGPLAEQFADRLELDHVAEDPDAPSKEQIDELRRTLASSSPEALSRVGLDGVAAGESLPDPWRPSHGDLTVLDSLERIEPIADWLELVEVASQVVERVESADQIERLMEGLARLGGERPDGLARRTEALRQRLSDAGSFSGGGSVAGAWGGVRLALVNLLETWLADAHIRTWSPFKLSKLGPYPFICRRLDEIALRLLQRRRDPLLAAPTHAGGWIEPQILIDRLTGLDRVPDPADFLQALLRLAPDRPLTDGQPVLEAASALGDAWPARVVRFALGGDGPGRLDRREVMFWLAAARSRDPRGSAKEWLGGLGDLWLKMAGSGPDGVEASFYSWRSETARRRFQRWTSEPLPRVRLWTRRSRLPDLGESYAPAEEQPTGGEPRWRSWGRRLRRTVLRLDELPTSALHRLGDPHWPSMDQQTEWQVEWAARVWPARTDAVLAAGVRWIIRRIETTGSLAWPDHAYLGSLFETYRPWTEMAYLAVSVASLSRDTEVKGTAVDALIEAIDDGRCHPLPLGDALVGLWRGGWPKPNRLAAVFEDVARVGPLHELAIALALDELVGSWQALPHGAHHLLTPLHAGFAALGLAPRAKTRKLLETVTTGGKTGKLVKAILTLESAEQPTPRHRAALVHAQQARLDRLGGDRERQAVFRKDIAWGRSA